MPRWFIQGSKHEANETELLVYQALNQLDDSWSVRWTYQYRDDHLPREGDFLILGPAGRLLVLEVKKRGRLYPREGTPDGKAADWFKKSLLAPTDVLLLTRHDPFSGKRCWFTPGDSFAGATIVPAHDKGSRDAGKLRITSFHKSKGLDAKAVILLDTLPWADLRPGDRQGYWIAASRARQLLAIFEMRKE